MKRNVNGQQGESTSLQREAWTCTKLEKKKRKTKKTTPFQSQLWSLRLFLSGWVCPWV